MKMKRITLIFAMVALMSSLVPSVFACYYYTPGYWKHNVTVMVIDRGSFSADIDGNKETSGLMELYLGQVNARSEVDPDLKWQQIFDAFWEKPDPSAPIHPEFAGLKWQEIRQMIADWFNEAKDAIV